MNYVYLENGLYLKGKNVLREEMFSGFILAFEGTRKAEFIFAAG